MKPSKSKNIFLYIAVLLLLFSLINWMLQALRPQGLAYSHEEKPFIHMEAIPTFEFLKKQAATGYFVGLIPT